MSISRNTTYNLLGSAFPIVVSLATIPTYLELIGAERYGTLAILWALLGYFGFMDLGLGRAVAQRLASAKSQSPYQRSGLIWTALAMTLALGVLAGLTLWFSAEFILSTWIKMSPENLAEARNAVPWFVLAMPLILSAPILSGALHGREHFLSINVLQIIGTTLALLLPLAAASGGHVGLDWLVPAALSARLITFAINLSYCRRRLPLRSRPHLNRHHIKPLLSFGGWVSVSGFLTPLLTAFDRMVIGVIAGPVAVTHFSIPFDLSSRLTIFSTSYAAALFPKMANETNESLVPLLTERVRILSSLSAPIFIFACYAAHWFFATWINTDFSNHATPVALLLIFGFYFNSLAILFLNHIQARGRADYVAKSQLIQLPLYLGLLYLLMNMFGVIGAALATAIRMLGGLFLLVLFTRAIRPVTATIFFPGTIVLLSVIVNQLWTTPNAEWGITGAIHVAIAASFAYFSNKQKPPLFAQIKAFHHGQQ